MSDFEYDIELDYYARNFARHAVVQWVDTYCRRYRPGAHLPASTAANKAVDALAKRLGLDPDWPALKVPEEEKLHLRRGVERKVRAEVQHSEEYAKAAGREAVRSLVRYFKEML